MSKNDILKRNDHETVRNRVGYYDFTHQLLNVTGVDAAKFLDKIFVNSIAATNIGGAQYTTMLNEQGIIIDDVIVMRFAEDNFWVSTLYIEDMIMWFGKHDSEYEVDYQNITDHFAMFAVQGPKSKEVLNQVLDNDINDIKWFTITNNHIRNIPVKVARAGFTGELGYEIYINPQHKELLVERLNKAGETFDIKEIKTDVILSSLPIEKGYVLMSDLAGLNPLEAAFGWSIDWDTNFIGKKALVKAKNEGISRKLRGFMLQDVPDDIHIEPRTAINLNGAQVGETTNFTYGYTVEKYIGYALIDPNKVKVGDSVTIKAAGQEVKATITERVFYDPDNTKLS